jgi:hypothetical protein
LATAPVVAADAVSATQGEQASGDTKNDSHDSNSDLSHGEADLQREREHPRPPLPEAEMPQELPWQRHGEVGVDFAWVSRPFARGLVDSPIRYRKFPALGIHLRWAPRQWLHVQPYFLWGQQPIAIPPGELSTSSPDSISPDTTFDEVKASSFVFGAKLAPTWNISSRWRAWLSAGVGYGRIGFRGMVATEPDGRRLEIPYRDGVFVELPVGIGVSFDVLPRWLAIRYEASGAPVVGQSGLAHEPLRIVDSDGKTREIGAFGAIQASFVHALGVALIM